MRRVAAALRHRNAAVLLLTLGVITWLLGTSLLDFGESDQTFRSAGVAIVLTASIRLAYLGLLAEEAKYLEGYGRGFRIGRRTSRPVVVPMPKHAKRPNAARSEPSRGHTAAHGRPAEPAPSRTRR